MDLLREIQTKCPELIASRDFDAIAAVVNLRRTKVQPHLITERGVVAALSTREGEQCLQALEAFSAATLPAEHPLYEHHAGIKRMLGWLKTTAGMEIDEQAISLLRVLTTLGVLQKAWSDKLIALATVDDHVTSQQVNRALVDDFGNWIGG